MMDLHQKYEIMKRKLIRAQTLKEEAIKRLQEEFNCNSTEEAESLIEELKEKNENTRKRLEKKIRVFQQKYASLLEESGFE